MLALRLSCRARSRVCNPALSSRFRHDGSKAWQKSSTVQKSSSKLNIEWGRLIDLVFSAYLPHLFLSRTHVTLVQQTALSAGRSIERFVEGFSSRIEAPPFKSTGRSAAVEGQTRLTLAQLDRLLVQYIMNEYNQSLHPRGRSQTRLERWQAGLASSPEVLLEQNFEV